MAPKSPGNASLRMRYLLLHQLQPVAERVSDVKAVVAAKRLVLVGLKARLFEVRAQIAEIAHQECRVRLLGRTEIAFDAEMQLLGPQREPYAAAHRQIGGFADLWQAEDAAIEGARLGFAAGRHRELQMIERDDAAHADVRFTLKATGGPLRMV